MHALGEMGSPGSEPLFPSKLSTLDASRSRRSMKRSTAKGKDDRQNTKTPQSLSPWEVRSATPMDLSCLSPGVARVFKLSVGTPQTEDSQRTKEGQEERTQSASSQLPALTPSATAVYHQPNSTPSKTPTKRLVQREPIEMPANTLMAEEGGSKRTIVRTAKSLDEWPLARRDTAPDWDPDLDVHRYRGGRMSMNGSSGRVQGGADTLSSPWYVGRGNTPFSRGSHGSNVNRSPSAPPVLTLSVSRQLSRQAIDSTESGVYAIADGSRQMSRKAIDSTESGLYAIADGSMPEGSNRQCPSSRWGSNSRRIQMSRGSTRGSQDSAATPGQTLKRRIRTLQASSPELHISEGRPEVEGLSPEKSWMSQGSIEQGGLPSWSNPRQGGWQAPGARDNTITGVPNFRSYRHQWISGKVSDSRVDGALLHAEIMSQKLRDDETFLVPLSSDEMMHITEAGAKVKSPPRWTKFDKGEGERSCFSPQRSSPWD